MDCLHFQWKKSLLNCITQLFLNYSSDRLSTIWMGEDLWDIILRLKLDRNDEGFLSITMIVFNENVFSAFTSTVK